MRKLIALAVLVVFISPVFAQEISIKNYEINYYIEDSAVRETIKIELASTNISSINFISGRVRDIAVRDSTGELNYNIAKENNGYVWTIFLRNDTNLLISFYSDEMVFKNNDISQFFSEISIDTHIDNLDVSVFLPPGNTIDTFYPKDGKTITDGKSIGIIWTYKNSDAIFLPLFVKFQTARTNIISYLVAVLLIIIIVLVINHYRKKVRREFLAGFFEDERKVVEYLIKNKTAYQNTIEKEFKFSRSKMTRIVKKLEQRGLVKKEKRGRTNKLEWKR